MRQHRLEQIPPAREQRVEHVAEDFVGRELVGPRTLLVGEREAGRDAEALDLRQEARLADPRRTRDEAEAPVALEHLFGAASCENPAVRAADQLSRGEARERLDLGQGCVGLGLDLLEASDAVARSLRDVERPVRRLEQITAIDGVVGEARDADRQRRPQLLLDLGLGELVARDPGADRLGERGGVEALVLDEDHGELVAGVADGRVFLAGGVLEDLADAAQHGVAGAVTLAVIDPLEEINVDHAERQRRAALPVIVFEELVEVSPVVQAGQLVGKDEFQQLGFSQPGELQGVTLSARGML